MGTIMTDDTTSQPKGLKFPKGYGRGAMHRVLRGGNARAEVYDEFRKLNEASEECRAALKRYSEIWATKPRDE
jgi:hypothetical protein